MDIRIAGSRDAQLSNMGSTVVAAVLEAEKLSLLNVGDSRAYIVRDNKMLQVSQDHSWVATQMRKGLLTKQEALVHPNRNRLSMAITAKRPNIKPYLAEEDFESTDILVLCSDGLWGVIPETLIWAAVSELAPQVAADKLVALANRSQSPDNISVIVARRFDPERKSTPISVEDTNPGL
jgi:protein phosphatase